jgi:hypothetical protein
MANKVFYTKKISNSKELCLVYGYVGDGMYNLFERDTTTQNTTEDFGIMTGKEAWDIFNAATKYEDRL